MATKLIKDVMTSDPIVMPSDATIVEAARAMRDKDIGDVIVLDDGEVCGIVTDRDLVVRALADASDPHGTKLGEVCSKNLTTLEPESKVGEAVTLMRDKALRRLPVIENGKPIGIVSLGDLAMERDKKSALADISAAPPNN
jgi:CBS domain-containing protein